MALYGKSGYVKPIRKRKQKDQSFSAKWGETADSVAQREDVAVATIHMRVLNYGTPWQRASKPSRCEDVCGKTTIELSEELNLHPISVEQRVRKYANPYLSQNGTAKEQCEHQPWRGRKKCWLMEEHPCYAEWKKEKQIADALLKIQAGYEG